jgi:hypothetical protein
MHAHVVRVRQELGNMARAMPHGNALTRYPGPVYRTGPPFLMLSLAPLHCSPLPPSRAMLRPGTSACRLGPETKRAAMHVAEGLGAQNGPGRTAGCQAFAAPASTIINIISREAAREEAIISRERPRLDHGPQPRPSGRWFVAVITKTRGA